MLLKGSFRLAVNLLQLATVAVRCSKNRKKSIICSSLALCCSCCNLQLVSIRLKELERSRQKLIPKCRKINLTERQTNKAAKKRY